MSEQVAIVRPQVHCTTFPSLAALSHELNWTRNCVSVQLINFHDRQLTKFKLEKLNRPSWRQIRWSSVKLKFGMFFFLRRQLCHWWGEEEKKYIEWKSFHFLANVSDDDVYRTIPSEMRLWCVWSGGRRRRRRFCVWMSWDDNDQRKDFLRDQRTCQVRDGERWVDGEANRDSRHNVAAISCAAECDVPSTTRRKSVPYCFFSPFSLFSFLYHQKHNQRYEFQAHFHQLSVASAAPLIKGLTTLEPTRPPDTLAHAKGF